MHSKPGFLCHLNLFSSDKIALFKGKIRFATARKDSPNGTLQTNYTRESGTFVIIGVMIFASQMNTF